MPTGYGGDEYGSDDVETLKNALGIGGRATSGAGHIPPGELSRIGNDPYLAQIASERPQVDPVDKRDLGEIRRNFDE